MSNRKKDNEERLNLMLDFIVQEEEKRSHTKLSRHQKQEIMKSVKLSVRIEREINQTLVDMPEQRLATANSILFNMVKGYLDEAPKLEEAKKRVRSTFMAQVAHIMAMISVYPEWEKYHGFSNLSHDQLRELFNEEYKKMLT